MTDQTAPDVRSDSAPVCPWCGSRLPDPHTDGCESVAWANRPRVDFDAWYASLPEPKRPANTTGQPRPAEKGQAERTLGDELTRVLLVGHLIQLQASAFILGQLVASGELDERRVRDVLTRAATGAGLDQDKVAAAIDSGLKAAALGDS